MGGMDAQRSDPGPDTGSGGSVDPERELLCEALGADPRAVTRVSREPLGAGSVTGFDVREPDGSVLRYYVDTSRLTVREETGMATGPAGEPEARIWLHPADPRLPALAAVAFHRAAESLLERMDLTAQAPPEFIAYRPGRRAVLRISTGTQNTWIKVVRPKRVARIAEAHAACERAGVPVPRTLGWSPEGVILIEQAVGTPAPDVDWDSEALLDRVDQLRDTLSTVQGGARVRGVASRLNWYAERLRNKERVAAIVDAAREALESRPSSTHEQTVHGDLHFGQLFLDASSGAITGLIDVDTLGIGDPAEDAAAFLAHASASALLSVPEARARVWALADGAMRRWGTDAVVRGLVAVHMLGHAGAAEDHGSPDAAERLLRVAEQVLAGRAPSTVEHEGSGAAL